MLHFSKQSNNKFLKNTQVKNLFYFLFFLLFFLLFTFFVKNPVYATAIETVNINDGINIENFTFSDRISAEDFISLDNKDVNIDSIVNANIFIKSKSFSTYPTQEENIIGGIITGDLFIRSKTIAIKSELHKDDTITGSKIYGSIFAITNTFFIDSGSEIFGDIFVIAKNVDIKKDVNIHGNVFILADDVNLHCGIIKSLYVKSKNYYMDYNCIISGNQFINSNNATINGAVFSSNINSKNIILEKDFENNNDFYSNSKKITLAGYIGNNANITSNNIIIGDEKSESNSFVFTVNKDLSYHSKQEIDFPDGSILR